MNWPGAELPSHPSPGASGASGAGDRSPPDPRVAAVIEAVRGHRTADEREVLSRAIILAELARLGRPLDEHADPTHVTASALVVGPRGVVLHRHRRLHRWLQPGGHLEAGEMPSEAALRECVEETGLPVCHPPGGPTLAHLDVHTAARGHVHLDLRYLVFAPDLRPAPGPGESQEVAWFSWGEALGIADDALAGGLESARRLAGAATVLEPGAPAHQREEP